MMHASTCDASVADDSVMRVVGETPTGVHVTATRCICTLNEMIGASLISSVLLSTAWCSAQGLIKSSLMTQRNPTMHWSGSTFGGQLS